MDPHIFPQTLSCPLISLLTQPYKILFYHDYDLNIFIYYMPVKKYKLRFKHLGFRFVFQLYLFKHLWFHFLSNKIHLLLAVISFELLNIKLFYCGALLPFHADNACNFGMQSH